MTKRSAILNAAKEKFPGKKLRIRQIGGDTELLVGEEGEHCYEVVEIGDGRFDFEKRD